jgi:hypothetical protein
MKRIFYFKKYIRIYDAFAECLKDSKKVLLKKINKEEFRKEIILKFKKFIYLKK